MVLRQEYRIVRKLESSIETTPAQPPVHLYALPPTAIRKVIFGARVEEPEKRALIAETKADPAFQHVAYAEAVLDPGQFKVEIRDYQEKTKFEVVDLQGRAVRL